jgi:dTDP-4-dehydrorhamnose reductase
MKVLVLGDGKLGSEIVKQTGWNYISRKKDGIDFTKSMSYFDYVNDYDTIVNCIANTNTYSPDSKSMKEINYRAVYKLSNQCAAMGKYLVHISTDYVYAGSENNATEEDMPVPSDNWYSYYKLLADEYIALTNPSYLICRCSFKSKPFEFNYAWYNQVGNFDYIDVIANLIIQLINKEAKGIYNVGTELKTMLELAKQTKPETQPSGKPLYAPENISMDLSKLKAILNENISYNPKP